MTDIPASFLSILTEFDWLCNLCEKTIMSQNPHKQDQHRLTISQEERKNSGPLHNIYWNPNYYPPPHILPVKRLE